jgi:predicted small secreted protein
LALEDIMKLALPVVLAAAVVLAGCQKAADGIGAGAGHGRYVGVGHFTPGRMWTQVVRQAAAQNPATAKPADDEQVIIVLDSSTGEVRQCGNLSGACIGMNPWSKPLTAAEGAPVAVAKHADQLDQRPDITAKVMTGKPAPAGDRP